VNEFIEHDERHAEALSGVTYDQHEDLENIVKELRSLGITISLSVCAIGILMVLLFR